MSDTFAASVPRFESDEIELFARQHFGAVSGLRLYPSERDQNARFALSGGGGIVVKIANAGESGETIALQHALLRHVQSIDPELELPRVYPTLDGRDVVTMKGPAGRQHFVRALTWLPGKPLADEACSPALLHSLGHKLGRLSKGLLGFFHPAAYRPDFLWNLENTRHALAWRDEVADDHTRKLINDLAAGRFAALEVRLTPLRQAVLYQDANDYNVLVSDGQIAGFIDFGDVTFGRQVSELAIALAYAALGKTEPLAVFTAITRGYTESFALTRAEIDVLFDLVMLRLAQSVCISSHRARSIVDNEYLTISQKPAIALLAQLGALDPAVVRDALLEAAGLAASAPADWEAHPEAWSPAVLQARRRHRIAPSLSVAYREPLTMVRGQGAWLFDHQGRGYLDMVNNVAHVGHCHPAVTEALARQARTLNTNARYLHKTLLDYADRIVATMPPGLSVCVFTCTGSEANELALRMARTFTGRQDAVVLDMAYHGNTAALVDISPYKFARKGGLGRKPFVHVASMPDPYRGKHQGHTEETGRAYAAEVAEAVVRSGQGPAFFIAESFLGVGGQIIPPPGFLRGAYDAVRRAGGVCIADEVQVGFGRPGDTMWAFQQQGVTPDIVTLGKPIGAGHPMAAVVTTPEVARAFANGMEYFNTFGGNPVSCAVGMAVMDVIEREGLQEHARVTGVYLQSQLTELAQRHGVIGDVRGRGLFIGVELVTDRAERVPAREQAAAVVDHLRHRGILLSTDGPDENVLKIKPPMVFSRSDADFFLAELADALQRLPRDCCGSQ